MLNDVPPDELAILQTLVRGYIRRKTADRAKLIQKFGAEARVDGIDIRISQAKRLLARIEEAGADEQHRQGR